MSDIVQGMRFPVDVKSGLVEQPQRAVLMKGDKDANRVTLVLKDGEKEVDLSGTTVTGSFVIGGVKIPLTGSASGNEATILLKEECYSESGRYELRMHVTMGGVKRTFLFVTGYIESDGEGGILDVDGVIPNIDDIVAQYETMKRVTAETEAARDEALEASRQATKFQVLDRYLTYDLLIAAHPTGEAGDAYAVGTEEDNVVYIWGVDVLAWSNIGNIQGPQGVGIARIERTAGDGSSGSVDTYTITYTDNTTSTYQVRNGIQGPQGVGIVRIERTAGDGSSGSVDTYTITYTDNTTSTYQVRNGKDAETNPYELTVGPGCRFATINAAIEHARTICSATERVLIRVMPGVYEEQITLNPNPGIDIEGSGMDITIIRYPSVYPNAPLYTCGQGSFTALTLQSSCPDGTENPSYGVHVEYQSAPDAGGVVRFERCRLQSRLSAAMGAGLGTNGGVQLTDCICVSETANAVYVHGYPESNVSGQTFTAHRCDFRALSGGTALHIDDVNGIYGLTGSDLTVECVGCRGGKMTLRTAAETFQGFVPNTGDVRLSAYSGDNEFVGANYGDLYNEVYVVCMRAPNGMLFVPWQNASDFTIMISSVMDSSGSDVTGTVSLHSAHRNGFLLTTTSTEAGPYWVQAVIYPGS